MKEITTDQLQKTVIKNNYCSGCGVCTATTNSPFEMSLSEKGNYLPKITTKVSNETTTTTTTTTTVCPFADHEFDETAIAKDIYKDESINYNTEFGYYKKLYAGFVTEGKFRKNGSSGGGVSWMTDQLLKEDLVDYIVHVKESNKPEERYIYSISNSIQTNTKGAKSRYYPTNMAEVLDFIKKNEGRYAIVSIPCFIKGINLLKHQEIVFKQRITYTISLFCGHLKTTHYLGSLMSQFNVETNEVEKFDFRHKIKSRSASDYGTEIIKKDGSKQMKLNKDLFGTNWGWGLFKLKACDYCDDIIGETADISFGDAWIPKYEDDYLGTNIIVTRNKNLDTIIDKAITEKKIFLENLLPNELLESQAGGFRHRREGLKYRLYLARKKKQWTPSKRIQPEKIKNRKRRKIYKLRIQLQQKSVNSTLYKNIGSFKKELLPLIKKIEKVNQHSAWTRMRLKLKSKF